MNAKMRHSDRDSVEDQSSIGKSQKTRWEMIYGKENQTILGTVSVHRKDRRESRNGMAELSNST